MRNRLIYENKYHSGRTMYEALHLIRADLLRMVVYLVYVYWDFGLVISIEAVVF